jgi:hypothetical protein
VTLNTTAVTSEQAGYFGTTNALLQIPVLDRTTGYTLTFDVRINAENHPDTDRAGFSVIVLGNDNKGVELGFWSNEIWAQTDSPLFTHGTGAAFNTTSGVIRYDLNILGSTYALSSGGSPITSGAVKDYSSFGAPYTTANFLFFGDNTTSADGSSFLSYVAVTVPEPGTVALLVAAAVAAAVLLRRRGNG